MAPHPLAITIDVEDHQTSGEPRFQQALAPLLAYLDESGARATFFVVGELVESWAAELRQLAAAGHEIGLHGYTHRFLKDLGPDRFADELRRGVETIGEVVGRRPVGFRAPYFSLTADTPWAPDAILEAGFQYSSSVLPAWNPQAGLRRAPRTPFRWSNGLLELPAPVRGIGPLAVPILGGAYLRLAPAAVVRLAARGTPLGAWTYSHPYDFDTAEPFQRVEGQPWWIARLLFIRRGQMLPRVRRITSASSTTLESIARDLGNASVPTFGLD